MTDLGPMDKQQMNGYECPYCGTVKPSENGTGSDVICCGERGHTIPVSTEKGDPCVLSDEPLQP